MEIDVMLCDFAQVAEGKLFMSGANISVMNVQPTPPFVVNFGVGAVVQVPYTATNQVHTIRLSFVDEDANPVVPWTPEGAPPAAPVEMTAQFNVGRPPGLPPGETQPVPFACNFMGLPMPGLGRYSLLVELDQTEMRRISFRVHVHQ